MKEAYFTQESLEPVSKEMLENLKPLIQPLRCPFEPSASALLVLDMQRQFLNPESHSFVPSAPAIVAGINRLINVFQCAHRPVILTRHVNTERNAGAMKRWWSHIITEDSHLSIIDPSVEANNASILTKTRYDAFIDTPLKCDLLQANVRCVLVTGVMTHICCDTTARSAFQHGFDTFIAIDGTATYNRHFHESSLYNLSHVCAKPVLLSDIIRFFTS